MLGVKSEEDIRFLEELPISTRQSLFIDYLFKEFLYKFGDFFKLEHNGILLNKSDSKWREFIYKFLYTLEPRHFTPDTIVLDQFEEASILYERLLATKQGADAVTEDTLEEVNELSKFYRRQNEFLS